MLETTAGPVLRVVHLDDDANDLLFFERAVYRAGIPFRVTGFLSPEKALHYLNSSPDTRIFVCDYNLGWLRAHNVIPLIVPSAGAKPTVVVLSGTTETEAMALSYKAGANFVVRKPDSLAGWNPIVRALYALAAMPDGSALLSSLPEYQPPTSANRASVSGLSA
jgi:CheY-like chemotaxis protein